MKPNKPLISIIIPVYNVSKYVKDCIKSVQLQTYSNLEIIIIDDGSTDDSGLICDQIAKKDSRIVVIHQDNGGLSAARNTGLDYHHGMYFCFVDSDDLIEKNYVEFLFNLIKTGNYQMAQVGTKIVSEDNKQILDRKRSEKKLEILDRTTFGKYLLLDKINVAAWANMYLSSRFKNVRFTKGKINEDFLMWAEGIKSLDTVIISSECLYRYRMREGSITHSKKAALYEACLENSKYWLKTVIPDYPFLKEAADFRYFFYLILVIKIKGFNEYKQIESSFFKNNYTKSNFLNNKFIDKRQKLYLIALYFNNKSLINFFNKLSTVK